MAEIQRRRFGRTNLMITELGFGAMNLRMLPNKQMALDLIHHVLDQGVNFIDTARTYTGTCGDGTYVESEELVGEALEARTDLKEPIVIVTKGHGYELKPCEFRVWGMRCISEPPPFVLFISFTESAANVGK